jgi:outer membrane protein assembly factor BamB
LIFGGIVALTGGAGTPISPLFTAYRPYTTVYHTAPAAADDIVTYSADDGDGGSSWIVGVSAQNGAVRWTKNISGVLLHPQPNLTIDVSVQNGVSDRSVRTIYAIRNADGAILWKISDSRSFLDDFPPKYEVDATRLYVLTDDPSSPKSAPEAYIAAYDLATGAQIWRTRLAPSSAATFHSLNAQFAVGDGLVFYAGEVSPVDDASIKPFAVQAFDAATGALRWTDNIGSAPDADGVIQAYLVGSLAVSAGRLIVAIDPRGWNTPPTLLALSERDGTQVWRKAFGVPQADSQAYADKQILWFFPKIATDANAIYLLDIFGVALSSAQQHFVVKIAATDGSPLMNTPFDTTQMYGDEYLTVVGSILLQSSDSLGVPVDGFAEGRSVIAYDSVSGKQLWEQTGQSSKLAWGLAEPQSGGPIIYLTALMDHSADPAPPAPKFPSLFQIGSSANDAMGVVFFYAADLNTGTLWWRDRTGSVTVRTNGW